MNKLLLSIFILLPSILFSSDLEELLTYDVGVENQLLFSRRCSALNFYFATFIPDFDQKAEEHGYFFNTISFGYSALNYYESREDYKNADEDRITKISQQIQIENDKHYDKYIDFYASLTRDRLKEKDFSDNEDFREILPSIILSDYDFCNAFFDFIQEEIDKSPDDLSNLREQ